MGAARTSTEKLGPNCLPGSLTDCASFCSKRGRVFVWSDLGKIGRTRPRWWQRVEPAGKV